MNDQLWLAFLAGFNTSAEGFNAEYPFEGEDQTEKESRLRPLYANWLTSAPGASAELAAEKERWPCGCVKGETPHGAGWVDCQFAAPSAPGPQTATEALPTQIVLTADGETGGEAVFVCRTRADLELALVALTGQPCPEPATDTLTDALREIRDAKIPDQGRRSAWPVFAEWLQEKARAALTYAGEEKP